MPKAKKRILVVDDHPAMRQGLRAIFHSAGDLTVCGEAEDAPKAIAAAKALKPDMAIVDISLGEGADGFEVMRRLHRQWPEMPLLAFSLHEGHAYCDAALAAGARGYCTKGEPSTVLIGAVRKVLKGQSFISEKIRRKQ
jgi:DNA-binding NarL/FixJ family response regulator